MSVRNMERVDMPATDISEVSYRLREVQRRLEEVCDDWSRQEMYDCIGYQSSVIAELADDLEKVFGVLNQVAG